MAVLNTSRAKLDVPTGPPSPCLSLRCRHELPACVAVGEVIESITDTRRGMQAVFADGNRESDVSIRRRHSLANSHERRRGSQEVTIVRTSANYGFVRSNRSQLCVYPRGNYCKEYVSENGTLMDASGSRNTHSRDISIKGVVNVQGRWMAIQHRSDAEQRSKRGIKTYGTRDAARKNSLSALDEWPRLSTQSGEASSAGSNHELHDVNHAAGADPK
jgi:hypothetical protein